MSNRINIIKLPTKNSKDINNNASNLSYTYKQFDCLVSNDINYNVHAEKEIINSSASTYNPDDSFERDIDGNHQDDINDINSTKLRDTFLNDTDSETSSLKRRSISSSEYMSDRFKVLVVNQHNGFIPSELQYNEQSSIATIIPANCINQKVNANQRSKLLSISSTASPTAESIAAVGLSIRSSSDASLEKATSVSGSKSTSSSYVPRNKTTEGDKILLSTQSSSVLALQDLKSSGSRLEVAGSKLKVAGAVSQSLSTSRSTSTTTAISSYSRPKSTHIDDKKELLYAYNMIKILQPQIPQFQSLNLVFDYIATSLYSLNDIIKLDNQNKIQHCLKYPDNLPNIINHLKNMAFLPENYHTLTNLSFLDYIINQSNTTTTSSNLTKSSVGLNITSTGKNSVINHHKISTNSSTSLGKNKMSLESQNFYSINHFESDSKKQKKENVATIGLINIYKTIKKHLETNNIKSKFFSSEDFVLVSEIFNETGLLLFPIINNNNNTFFNSLANKMNVDIMVIENLIIQYIENNKNNPIFLLSVYNPDIGSNENSLLQK